MLVYSRVIAVVIAVRASQHRLCVTPAVVSPMRLPTQVPTSTGKSCARRSTSELGQGTASYQHDDDDCSQTQTRLYC